MENKHFMINRFKVFFVQSIVMLVVVSAISLFDVSRLFSQYGVRISAEDAGAFAEMENGGLSAAGGSTGDAVGISEQMRDDGAAVSNTADTAPQAKKVVVIDAGHGGSDTGTYTLDKSVIEKDATLKVVRQLKKMFDGMDGIEVYYTRLEDKAVSKEKRLKLAHEKKADLFISIHCNAGNWGDYSSYGTEALYSSRKYKGTSVTGKKLAEKLAGNVSKAVDGRDRGVRKREDLYLLGHSKVPACIIEVGYISSSKDLKYIKSEKGQKKIAGAIRDTVADILK